jgi:xanthine dehydrogenase accessory factor
MQTLFDEIVALQEAGETFALATVVDRTGSVPMSKWAKMLVRRDGSMSGTVGGGCLEAEIWEDARVALASGEARVVEHTLTLEHAGEFGLLCGGTARILVERIAPDTHADVLRAARDTVAARKRAHLIALLPGEDDDTRRLLLMPDESTIGSLGDEATDQAAIAAAAEMTGQIPGLKRLEDPARDAFIEPLGPMPEIYIFGGGHVGLATVRVGAVAGFRVIVIDDRPTFCNPERFPEADECIVAEFDGAFERLDIGEDSYIVTVTRGHAHDETVVRQALATNAGYIGMIGSRAKVRGILRSLGERGATDEQIARIHAPIGLDIGADTPEEIAVSILAEIIAVMRRGDADGVRRMRDAT